MAVGSGTPYNFHTGNGVTTTFAFGFTVLDAADLSVKIDGVATSAYTVSGIGVPAGGSITFTSAPANGTEILISLVMTLQRLVDYQSRGDLQADVLNGDFDRLWQALLLQQAKVNGAVRAQYPNAFDELPDPAGFEGYYIGLNSSAQPAYMLAPSGTAAAVVSDLASVADGKGAEMIGIDDDVLYAGQSVGGYIMAGMPSIWWVLSDAEIADVKAYGYTIDLTAKIQAALDKWPCWFFPYGGYKTTAALEFNDGNVIFCAGYKTEFHFTHNGAFLKGKGVTTAATTNVRRYNGGMYGGRIVGPGVASTSSIGIDARGMTMFSFQDILVQSVYYGTRRGDGYSTYYNTYRSVHFSTVHFGHHSTELGNSNPVYGGRVNDCVVGTYNKDNSHDTYHALAVETFTTTAHQTVGATLGVSFEQSRIENAGGTGTCFNIDALSQDTLCSAQYARGYGTLITESSTGIPTGVRTTTQLSEYHTFSGGRAIKWQNLYSFTIDIPNMAAGTTAADIAVTVSGALPTDVINWIPPTTLEAGVQFNAIPGTGQHFLRASNVSAGVINPASATWYLQVTRYVL